MENVAIYARYSSHSQTEASIEGQLKVCHEYAERNNLKIVHEYIDRALSGTSDKRPEFQQMIKDSDHKMFDYVLVYQLDRFARDRYDSATYKHKLKKNGVRVISAKENISNDASGVLMESVLEGMAEYYSVELAQKIKRGMNLNGQKCKYNGGLMPYGYKKGENNDYVIDKEEAKIVKRIFETFVEKQNATLIANELNALGLKTTAGYPWDIDAVRRLLANEKYIGNYRYKEIFVKNGIPSIIDDETFSLAQEILKKRKQRHHSKENIFDVDYPLTGKIFCAECGCHIVGDSSKNGKGVIYRYYTCMNRKKGAICRLPSIRKNEIEEAIAEILRPLLSDNFIETIVDKALKEFNENYKSEQLITQLENELSTIKDNINKFTDLLIQTRNIDVIMDKIDELKTREEEISKNLYEEKSKEIKVDRQTLINKVKKIRDFKQTDLKSLQKFADMFIYRIYVNKDKKIAVLFKLSDGLNRTNCSDKYPLVEQTRIELATSTMRMLCSPN